LRLLHQSTNGDAMKIEEYVPTTIPIRIAKAKSRRTGPPKKKSDRIERRVIPLVNSVRDRVSLIDEFMID
jgi:hypothetical protein